MRCPKCNKKLSVVKAGAHAIKYRCTNPDCTRIFVSKEEAAE